MIVAIAAMMATMIVVEVGGVEKTTTMATTIETAVLATVVMSVVSMVATVVMFTAVMVIASTAVANSIALLLGQAVTKIAKAFSPV